jgi:hypothetical protein
MCIVIERPVRAVGFPPELDGHGLVESSLGVAREQSQARSSLSVSKPVSDAFVCELEAPTRDLYVCLRAAGIRGTCGRSQQRTQVGDVDIEAVARVCHEGRRPDVRSRGDLSQVSVRRQAVEMRGSRLRR